MIRIENVTKIYRTGSVEVAALRGVSLAVEAGEMTALMGVSGSGKSTLMNIIGCLDVPTSGMYALEGEDVCGMSDDRLAELRSRRIGFVFQTYNLLPRLSALANVELALMYGGRSRDRRRRALDALERVGLGDRTGHRPAELSGGQQQRVGIARALVKNPDILLADEPTGNLDSRSGEEIMEILAGLNRDTLTVIMVTHEPNIAAYARRTVTLLDGRILGDERARDPESPGRTSTP